jgi:glucose-1-phosphate thymidylyltransferase
VRGNSLIIHPSVVDPSTTLERAIVGPFASVGENCTISHSNITDSIIEDGATVASANLKQSIVGFGAAVRGRESSINVGDSSNINL